MKRKRIGSSLVLLGVVLSLAPLSVSAFAHDDGGVDEPFIAPDMNQESYWEDRFNGECWKYEDHDGEGIPGWADVVIVHDGQYVRVYDPAPSRVLGPHNPNNDKHFDPPHSWVMMCRVYDDYETTTTTVDDTTTTTVGEETTTTVGEETTTTVGEETTTTVGEETTTTVEDTTTTSVEDTTTTTDPELPFTGAEHGLLALVGVILLGVGSVLTLYRREEA